MFYIIATIGEDEGPVTLPSGKPRAFESLEIAERVADTLRARVRITRYRVEYLPESATHGPGGPEGG